MEHRSFTQPVEYRAGDISVAGGGGRSTAAGYVMVWGEHAAMPGHEEVFEAGAFTDSLHGDIRALWGHDHNAVLGRTRSGTLQVAQDTKGLSYRIDLPDTTHGRDAAELLARGDVSGASVGMIVDDDHWTENGNGYPLRIVRRARLFEVSLVAWPAYPTTTAGLA